MRLSAWVIAAMLVLTASAWGQEAVPYRAELVGIDDRGLRDAVERASRLLTLEDEPPSSLAALRRRGESDLDRIREVLRSEGWYDGNAKLDIDEAAQPARVTLTVTPGTRYALASVDIDLMPPPGSPAPEPVGLDALGLSLGEPARAQPVLKAQEALLRALSEQGFPLAEVTERRVEVDHAALAMRVRMAVATGPLARFGPVTVEGAQRLDPQWVLNRVPWRRGERFSLDPLEKLRKRLVEAGLFSSVKVEPGKRVDEAGELPITIAVTEGNRRSIGAGVAWSSDAGPSGNAFWEHRNLLGGAETLRLSLTAGGLRDAADVSFRHPDLGRPDQDFVGLVTAEQRTTRAYTTRTAGTQAGLEWLLTPAWKTSAAVAVERTEAEEADQRRLFTLVSLPLGARFDDSDDLLDPTRGNRMTTELRPFPEQIGSTIGFTRFELRDSQYLTLLDQPRLVLAGWADFGTIQGAKAPFIPADKRFYVGGGGSVRAYGHQLAGPITPAGDPAGGRSALAFGGELRIRATETIGVVPFVEAGRAYSGPLPDWNQRLFWGPGVGLRYHTPIGPIRADLAVPMLRREGIDSSFQVYLSLGQAF